MKRLAPIGILLMLLPAPLQARTVETFCTELRRIVAAASEAPPFASLPKRDDDHEWFGGVGTCHRVTQGGDSFHCRIWTRGAPDGRPGLVARTQSCLPEALLEIDDPDSRNHWERRLTRLRAGAIAIDVAEHGGPGVHIGWYYRLEIAAAEQ